MNFDPNSPLGALKLWQAAESQKKAKEYGFRNQQDAQLRLAESVAAGEFPTHLLPAARRVVTEVYDQTEVKHGEFTSRKTVTALDVDERVEVFKMEDQSNIPGENAGDRFIAGGLPRLMPREKYPNIGFSSSTKSIRASKIGEAFSLDWETIVRTRGARVDLIRSAFTAFGRHARQQEDIDVAKLLVNGSGFVTGEGSALSQALHVTGNPDFSDPEMLPKVISDVLQRKVGDEQVGYTLPNYDGFTLLVGRGMAGAAQRMLNTRTITRVPARTGSGSETRGQQYEETIPLGADVNVVEWGWLNRIFDGFGRGWVLVPRVSGDELDVLTSNYLEGYESPQVFVKDSNSRLLTPGGGLGAAVNPLVDGDYDSDAVETKVRHAHGASALWTSAMAYSTGANA